jgi:acetamidase/formamidase
LSAEILKITPVSDGYTCIYPGHGGLVASYTKNNLQSPLPPKTIICPIRDRKVLFPTKDKIIELPFTPFVGTIATAPSRQKIATLQNSREFLGNVDCSLISPGNTVVLPVNVEGGLLFLGDVHAVQGHGEISGTAIECRAEISVRVKVIRKDEAKYVSWPQINNSEYIGSIGCVSTTLEDALKAGYIDLILRIEKFHRLDRIDAYQLLSQVGEVLICQVVPPLYSCVAKVHRGYLN